MKKKWIFQILAMACAAALITAGGLAGALFLDREEKVLAFAGAEISAADSSEETASSDSVICAEAPVPPESGSAEAESSDPADTEPEDAAPAPETAPADDIQKEETAPPPVVLPPNDSQAPAKTPSSTASQPDPPSSTTPPPAETPQLPAANETLTVMVNGKAETLPALEVVSKFAMAEVGPSFSPEAIKAQAVASHTYVKYYNLRGQYPSMPNKTVDATLRAYVAEVIDKMVYYQGEPILAVYSASNNGHSRASKDVWGGDLPYLVSVESKYDSLAPTWGRKVTYSPTEFAAQILKTTGISLTGNPASWIATQKGSDGYISTVTLGGKTVTASGKKITGHYFRETVMGLKLYSASFDVTANNNEITFTTYGHGHGVGMSQYGAHFYALKEGWSYRQILEHYYPGATVA